MINIEINDHAVLEFFHELSEKSEDLPLDEIGRVLVDSIHENFRMGGRPDVWEPRKKDYDWPLLMKSRDLYNSINYDVNQGGDNSEVNVSYGEEYGKFHDEGTVNLPERQFMCIQPEDVDKINDILAQHFMI